MAARVPYSSYSNANAVCSAQRPKCHAVQIADVTRCTWDGPLPRCVGFVQGGHHEVCRGCFAASDCRASLLGIDYGKKGVNFAIALPRFRLPGKVDVLCKDGHRSGLYQTCRRFQKLGL